MRDRSVSGWSELNELLYERSLNNEIRRFRSNFVFRGLRDSHWNLETSLMRLGENVALELRMLRHFQKYAYSHRDIGDSLWHWLAVAQHHGLPTRLLDWTYSPFVAAHFATEDSSDMEKDGAIWCVDTNAVAGFLPAGFQKVLDEEKARAFTAGMLDSLVPDLEALNRLGCREPLVLFFDPPSLDDRVVNQHALFSVATDPRLALQDWLHSRPPREPEWFHRIIIPAERKWEIRDKLDQANISERMLFPGLDGVARYLKRHYSPGPKLTVPRQKNAAVE